MRVQKIGDNYGVILPPAALEALGLVEGAEIELKRVEALKPQAESRYIGVEEGMAAHKRTEHLHRNTYQELAK